MCLFSIYNRLNDDLCYDLMGELIYGEDKIIWTYNIHKNIDMVDEEGISEEEVEIISIEEKLQEAYYHDIELIKNNIHLFFYRDDWYFTEPVLNSTTIHSEFFVDDIQ